MPIDHLTLFLTDRCNFSCSYCAAKKRNRHMTRAMADKAVLSFLPLFSKAPIINFYGGEPLLRFGLLKHVAGRLCGDPRFASIRPRFALTTNGSLVTPEILEFLEDNRFSVTLSFDGPGQDIRRRKGSCAPLSYLARRMASSQNLDFEVNTVVTPADAGRLTETVRFLLDLGVRNIRLSPSLLRPWTPTERTAYRRGLAGLRRYLTGLFRLTGHVPALNFREKPEPGIFRCGAGSDRAAVTTGGEIWGCHLFADYGTVFSRRETRKYLMGRIGDPPELSRARKGSALREYSRLSQDAFSVRRKSCLFCSDIENCSICPLSFAAPGRPLGSIPVFACALQKIRIAEVRSFHGTVFRTRPSPGLQSQ